MSLDQQVPTVGPLTANQLTSSINQELAELYRRSLAVVGSPAGTNNYTGSIPLSRPIEDGNGLIFRVPNTNTGPCDLNGISIVTPSGAALQSGQLLAGMEIIMIRNQASNTYRVHTPLAVGSAPILRVYATPGTFTWNRPSGLRWIKVRVQAGGGSGAFRGSAGQAGGAGSGGYGERIIQASLLSATVTITVGAGGATPSTSGTTLPGNTGGASSFGAFVLTNGGLGGGNGSQNGTGGNVGTGGDVNMPGQAGGIANASSSGYGGNSPFGGAGGSPVLSGNGVAGVFGGGASGPWSGVGGAGGNGIVTVEEIY